MSKLKLIGFGPRNIECETQFMPFDSVDCGVVSGVKSGCRWDSELPNSQGPREGEREGCL